jgi:hypothetical protein
VGKELSPGPALTEYLQQHPAKTPLNLEDVPGAATSDEK